ncbi:MAG: hypothetical protein ACYDCM_10770 [Candidatus Acidiferrales bacterium]
MRKYLGHLPLAFAAAFFFIAGCSHAVFPGGGSNGGNGTSPLILTFHDTPPSGVTVTSFEVTITGAVLQPGNVSLLAAPQTIELTQLQTNSVLLSTTKVAAATYTSLQITYANPKFTFLNDSGVAVTVGGQTCNAGASCLVATPTTTTLTNTVSGASFSVPPVSSTNQTLLEFDVNLNNIIQPSFSLDFSKSGAVSVIQSTAAAGSTPIGNINVTGQVGTVTTSPNQFQLTTSTGQTLTIPASSSSFQFARDNCAANDFTCLATGQIVDASVNIMNDGTLQAVEVDFDDASTTQQVSGTIVAQTGTPPTSFQMIVHNTVPPVTSLPVGTPVTVTIGAGASFVINNGLFVLPTGVTFATTSDLLVGQEVQARVASGTSISNGAFTSDRLALEQTQLEANVSSISPQASPFPLFVLNTLPPIFSQPPSPATQLQILVTGVGQSSGTVFEDLTPLGITGLSVSQSVTVGGFLFNTAGTIGSPTIVAATVRGEVPGT